MQRLTTIAGLILAIPLVSSQTPQTKPSFEVASIKPNTGFARSAVNIGGNRFAATAWPLRPLIMEAYQLRDFQITGGPDWINTEQWDIDARAQQGIALSSLYIGEASRSTVTRLMLQSLIEERFRFKFHRETKEVAVYELSIAPGGLKITRSADQTPVENPAAATPVSPGGTLQRGSSRVTRGQIEVQAQSFANFVYLLSRQLDRPLIDRTNLQGLYDIKLQWTPEVRSGIDSTAPSDPPLLFTATEEQLGLKLQGGKAPSEVLIIDSVQKPTEN